MFGPAEVVAVGVTSSADLAGNVTIGVSSSADPASVVTTGVAFREECGDNVVIPTDCDYDIAEVAPSAKLAGDVTIGVAFREKCRDSVVIPSDCVCDYDEIAEVASSVELAGNVTVGVAPPAHTDSVFTAGTSSVENYQERNVLPSGVRRSPADTDESIVELEAIGMGAPWFLNR